MYYTPHYCCDMCWLFAQLLNKIMETRMRGGNEDDNSICMPSWMEEDLTEEDEEDISSPNLDPDAEEPIDDEEYRIAPENHEGQCVNAADAPVDNLIPQLQAPLNPPPDHHHPMQPAAQQNHHTLPKGTLLLRLSVSLIDADSFSDCHWLYPWSTCVCARLCSETCYWS
jgi:hypothetical protein